MKGLVKKIIFICLIICLVAAGIIFGGSTRTKKSAEFRIEEGTSTRAIATQLKEEGIIGSEISFLVKLRLSSYSGKLQYGVFAIEEGWSMNELFEELTSGGIQENTINITIPEGFSAEKIGDLLEKNGMFSKEEFLEAANTKEGYDFSWLDDIKEVKGRKILLQGYLYPDTYNFYKDAAPQQVVAAMLENFESHYNEIDTDMDMDELVTMASVIEREVAVPSESKRVAGVIKNRLEQNMRLQIDPTALYPLTDGMYDKKKVTYEDLEIESPYNTYRNTGLPVGPICSPSLESMKAAAEPESHDYLYYHTKKDSQEHEFFKTYEEHLKSQK